MATGVFTIQQDGQLLEMREAPHENEDIFQKMIDDYPALISGEQINPENPCKWLPISREEGVPDGEDSGNRWSIDNLFVDQEGIPTLIEVKRSSDTRLRREVIGQILEYAANSTSYWLDGRIRSKFESECEIQGIDATEKLQSVIGTERNIDEFWQVVATNLQAGKIRLLIVADIIPEELKRIIEFLNIQMNPAEILAVEIRQYVSDNVKTLIPRTYGRTAMAEAKKSGYSPSSSRRWNEKLLLDTLEKLPTTSSQAIKKIYDWAIENHSIEWRNNQYMMFRVIINENKIFGIYCSDNGYLEFMMSRMRFENNDKIELIRELNTLNNVNISEDKTTGYPTIKIPDIANDADKLTSILDATIATKTPLIDEFAQVIKLYDSQAINEYISRGNAINYRQIHVFGAGCSTVHYEFLDSRKDNKIGIEIHIEHDKFTYLQDILRQFVDEEVQGKIIEWDGKACAGRGKIFVKFPSSATQKIVDAMNEFIALTKDAIQEAIDHHE